MSEFLLSLRKVSVRFGKTLALEQIDLEIFPHDRIAVVGPSGGGKTTLLSVAAGIQRPSSGTVTRSLGLRLGLLLQDPVGSLNPRWRIDRIVGEPLLDLRPSYSEAKSREAVSHALEGVGLGGMDPSRRASELSVGQCQRLALARALVAGPRLLLADEPTSALDSSVAAGMLRLLDDRLGATGAALLVVSHDVLSVAPLVRRIIVVDQGRIVETAPPDQLLKKQQHPTTARLVRAAERLSIRSLE